MKRTILILLVTLMALTGSKLKAQTPAMKEVKQTIQTYMTSGDQNDAKTMAALLDPNYRVIMNRLFGSTEVSIMTRELFLEKIESKEFGGDKRSLTFSEVTVNGTTAVVNVQAKGAKATIQTIIVLIKDDKDNWKLVSETPLFM